MRARRLRTLAARSSIINPVAAPLVEDKKQRVQSESRLVREALAVSSSVDTNLGDKASLNSSPLMNKTDTDVEMKSVASTPVQDVEMATTPALHATPPTPLPASFAAKPVQPQQPVIIIKASQLSVDQQNEQMLSRLLNATWNEYGSGVIICAQTATFLEQYPALRFEFEAIICNVLLETVMKFYHDEIDDSLKLDGETSVTATGISDANGDDKEFSSAKKIKSDDTEVQEILANAVEASAGGGGGGSEEDQRASAIATPNQSEITPSGGDACVACVAPTLPNIVTTSKHNALLHLIRCYQNYHTECERTKANDQSGDQFRQQRTQEVLRLAYQCIMRYVVLELTDRIQQNRNYLSDQSTLLELMYMDRVSDDFLIDLVAETYQKREVFDSIFGQVLRGLFSGMQRNICSYKINTQQIEWLSRLVVIKVGNSRPFADLISRQPNYIPPTCTKIPGREIVKCSYLGPFLSVSLFAEENVKFAEFSTKNKLEEAAISRLRWVSERESY